MNAWLQEHVAFGLSTTFLVLLGCAAGMAILLNRVTTRMILEAREAGRKKVEELEKKK